MTHVAAMPPEGSNVIPLRPPVPHDIRPARTTRKPIRPVRTTAKTGEKPSNINVVALPVSCREDRAHVDVSCVRANAELSKTEFLALVKRLSGMALIDRFPLDHSSWRDMRGRRRNGCEIAPEFRNFRSFLRHMGVPRPGANYTLDRINPFRKEYGPGLCRWAPRHLQDTNRTDTIRLTGRDGRTLPLIEWAALTRQDAKTLRQRRARHPEWTDAQIIHGADKAASPTEPEAEAAPADAAPRTSLHGWPAGMTDAAAVRWEAAFQAYQPMFPRSAGARLTRPAFFAWIFGNVADQLADRLRTRWPGLWDADTDPEELDWPAIQADPDYSDLTRGRALLDAARREIWTTDPREEIVSGLRSRFPTIRHIDPVKLGRLRWHQPAESVA